jgi:hypothetical protein
MADKPGARKCGRFTAVSLTPDVCETPYGKSSKPVPYNITADLSQSAFSSHNVFFGGYQAFLYDQSIVIQVSGDEQGTNGGVKSGTCRGIVEPIEASGTVFANKKKVVRHGDRVEMNNGNTIGRIVCQAEGGGDCTESANPPVAPETPEEEAAAGKKKGGWSQWSPSMRMVLDITGMIPGAGLVSDIANVGLNVANGQLVSAGIAAVSAVPVRVLQKQGHGLLGIAGTAVLKYTLSKVFNSKTGVGTGGRTGGGSGSVGSGASGHTPPEGPEVGNDGGAQGTLNEDTPEASDLSEPMGDEPSGIDSADEQKNTTKAEDGSESGEAVNGEAAEDDEEEDLSDTKQKAGGDDGVLIEGYSVNRVASQIYDGIRKNADGIWKGTCSAIGQATNDIYNIATDGHPLARSALMLAGVTTTGPLAVAGSISVGPALAGSGVYASVFGWAARVGPYSQTVVDSVAAIAIPGPAATFIGGAVGLGKDAVAYIVEKYRNTADP